MSAGAKLEDWKQAAWKWAACQSGRKIQIQISIQSLKSFCTKQRKSWKLAKIKTREAKSALHVSQRWAKSLQRSSVLKKEWD